MTFANTLPVSLLCFSLFGCMLPPPQTDGMVLTNLQPPITERKVVSINELTHRHFVLLSVDGTPWQSDTTKSPTHARAMYPGIDFNEKNMISSTFCNELQGHVLQQNNRIQGTLTLLNNSARVNQQIQNGTKIKTCEDKRLNQWDTLFQQMINEGVTLEVQSSTLFIDGAGHTMSFTLRDWVY
ncbi:hypothetical protein [Plesiomonas sp.]|uniref:hypothetical protein n=1 Tax=Plesiomonas sp. TaxID=2486279 RepID=UPI003F30CD3D